MAKDCPKCEAGLPPWLATFADLMSLLMCFFVLLLSFAEVDAVRFKKMAESMKDAFGVQREIPVSEVVMGTSVIKQEFSPSTSPESSPINELRQQTTDEEKQKLEVPDEKKSEGEDSAEDRQELQARIEQLQEKLAAFAQVIQEQREALQQADPEKLAELEQALQELKQELAKAEQDHTQSLQESEQKRLEELERSEEERLEQEAMDALAKKAQEELEQEANDLKATLKQEIAQGLVTVETAESKIIIRIQERGSFPSGSADFNPGFLDVIDRISDALVKFTGRVIVAGHTDNVPIYTSRFRSNWELSSARAVTVVHALLMNPGVSPERVLIEGHADSNPLVPNDSTDHRAKNRRVELILVRGEEPGKREVMDVQ